jgi:hypothetical protein
MTTGPEYDGDLGLGDLGLGDLGPGDLGPGDLGLGLLADAWDQTAQHWRDDIARQFEAHHWTPLLRESRSYLEALRKLTDVLSAAERDTWD